MNSFCPASQSEIANCMDKQHYTMLLAPFQPSTRIELETNVNTNTECCLNIRNTSDKTLNVIVTKKPAIERQIILSSSELEIQGNSNGTIYIKWFPREAGSWRDVLQLTDNRRIKYDIIIATTAKDNKKKNAMIRRKPSFSSSSNFSSLSITNKRPQQRNTSLKVSTNNQSLISNLGVQTKQCIPKYKNESNKENICEEKNEIKTYTLQKQDKINENSLFEQNVNVWNDGSILPQVFLPSNTPQDIRRATYIKEKKPCNSILYEYNEEVIEDTACIIDKTQSEFSVLLDKFTFTSTDIVSSSPQPKTRESINSTNSQSVDKHRTFNISHDPFDTFAISDMKFSVNAPSTLQSTKLYNSSLIEPKREDESSPISNVKDLRVLSPIQPQHNDTSKDSVDHSKQSTTSINRSVQTNDCEYFTFEIIPENITEAKKAGDMYIEISPPKKCLLSKSISSSKLIKNMRAGKVIKNKTSEEKNMKLYLNISSELFH